MQKDHVKALLISGNEHHKWHHWEETTPLIQDYLQEASNISVDVSFDIEVLADEAVLDYNAIILNYCNWHDPTQLSDAAKSNIIQFAENGGGIVILHFANGAFHFSLPEAGESDWPEYRKIVPRVWNHHGDSEHDKYGKFTVKMTNKVHPITEGLSSFDTIDELYYKQEGEVELEPLYTARSNVSNQDEPLAWVTEYRNARVYQTLLGHNGEAYAPPQVQEMLRRSVLWVARQL